MLPPDIPEEQPVFLHPSDPSIGENDLPDTEIKAMWEEAKPAEDIVDAEIIIPRYARDDPIAVCTEKLQNVIDDVRRLFDSQLSERIQTKILYHLYEAQGMLPPTEQEINE